MSYFKEPDGKDCLGKTAFTTKVATAGGLASSMYAYLFKYGKLTPVQGLINGGNITLTMAALGAVFGATTCISTSVRGKDGRLNYFIGGCTTGALLGVKAHSYAVGFGACAGFGISAALYKHGKMEDWPFVIQDPRY
ncbi:NADH dehydrogenase [ubiquinone] 1 alpha subcomplex subunit 11-like [Saccoglossus kowalevskii]|uniref:NADH dehydrogenase [ubiquinone] 1 alpha subcomplex subunit 11 n=1 Tax=Saccoglossus kowalevskii TaxID=10224 RepID=A0ABM0GLM0_SACKO|nr:PREDICTED: NADH dehydrogenase [ubiquinone] 1 alpha subcomplex subunit 11-like [Saccoglossus kowalevskii]